MNKLVVGVLVVVLLVGGVAVSKDGIAKGAVEKIVTTVTGLELKISKLNIGILSTLVGIKELKLFNPKSYTDRVMIDVPEVYVNYNLSSILGGKIHLEELRFDVKELVIVKSADGKLNLSYLQSAGSKKSEAKPADAKPEAKSGKKVNMQIDKLSLKVGKVIYKDYTKGAKPQVMEFNVNLNEQYQNISDPSAIVALLVTKSIANTTLSSLLSLDVTNMVSNLGVSGAQLSELGLGKFAGAAGEVSKQAQALVGEMKSNSVIEAALKRTQTGAAGVGGTVADGTEATAQKLSEGASKAVEGLTGLLGGASDTQTQQ